MDILGRYSLTTLVDKVLNVLKLEKTSMKFQTSSALKSDPENQVILCISYAPFHSVFLVSTLVPMRPMPKSAEVLNLFQLGLRI